MTKTHRKKLLMIHLVAGFPTERESLKLADRLVKAGADILEIQIPFSDPIADGPTIVGACHKSLENGFTAGKIFSFLKKLQKLNIPIVVMTYGNVPYKIGFEKFVRKISEAGAIGLIAPDLPFDSEDAKNLFEKCQKYNIDLIQVISPGTYKDRLAKATKLSGGFVYCTTRKGTTGRQLEISKTINNFLKQLKSITKKPIALGFGISTLADIRLLKKQADILIIGSTIVKKVSEPGGLGRISDFIQLVRSELDK